MSKLLLPILTLSEVCDQNTPGAKKRSLAVGENAGSTTYYYRAISSIDHQRRARWIRYDYNLFPVVLDRSGVPWDVANLYILSRLEGTPTPNMGTYSSIAEDLSAYLSFLENEGIDFTLFLQRKLHRPTYRYHGELKFQVEAGELAAPTAKRRMGTVIAFYRWLVGQELIKPAYPTWQESDRYINYMDARGFSKSKKIATTDISIKPRKQDDPFVETIDDGGKLKPLTGAEQEWLLEALINLENTEMSLVHLLALLTGARIQTVLTLRVKNVQLELPAATTEFRLNIGPGTQIDTKFDKSMTLTIPGWFYERLRIYAHSDRAKKRRYRAVGGDIPSQYLFLSNQGSPFYQAKEETRVFDANNKLRHFKNGQAVRQFMMERVIPWIQKNHDKTFRYQFHDLRATFGMNLTASQLALVQQGTISLHDAREFVRTRMGHDSGATTDRYLKYRDRLTHARTAQSDFEQHLRKLSNKAMEGLL